MSAEARAYRFAPRDIGGWLLGLDGVQCLLLTAGLFTAGVVLRLGGPAPAALLPVAVSVAFGLSGWAGQRTHEHASVAVGFATTRGRRSWRGPLLAGPPGGRVVVVALPEAWGTCELVALDAASPMGGAAAVGDRGSSFTGVVAVSGAGFALAERAEQTRLLAGWGDVLAGFCAERGPVARVVVSSWCGPGDLTEARASLADAEAAGSDDGAARDHEGYRRLLADAERAVVGHETLVAVTVETRRLRRQHGRRQDADAVAAGCAALAIELDHLRARLDGAGLVAGPPLGLAELATALRKRLDPSCALRLRARARSLAEAADALIPPTPGPLAVEVAWDHVRTDGWVHAGWWIAEWPRLEVGPGWMEPLLATTTCVRNVVIHIEPTPPSAARRRIERDATRLATDSAQRAERGFRIGARHHRAEEAVAERESELVAGYSEVGFVGLVVASAPELAALVTAGDEVEQAAAAAGLELRRLDGRHDLALAASLPIGRALRRPRLG